MRHLRTAMVGLALVWMASVLAVAASPSGPQPQPQRRRALPRR